MMQTRNVHDRATQAQTPVMSEAEDEVTTPAILRTGRFRYADPRDLPSFPSSGLKDDDAAASAAASLGWANQRLSTQSSRPDIKSVSASAAAALARDPRTAPVWDSNGKNASARAALLAAESAGKPKPLRPALHARASSVSNVGITTPRSPSMRQTSFTTPPSQGGSLAAAKDAMASVRPRSKSTPQLNKDSQSSPAHPTMSPTANALSAATLAHRPSIRPTVPVEEGGAVPYTTLPRKMFTATPPIGPEAEDQRKSDMIHASAVAMARKMYSHQQKMVDATSQAHREQEGLNTGLDSQQQPKPFVNLQEAAYSLAQERLSKLHEEHQRNREMQEYYGAAPPTRRSTVINKLRRRASSDSDLQDRKQSEKIRQQMSIFSTKLSEVDEQKRAKDREALLATAQRNVRAQLDGMDQKVWHETGRVAPSILGEWEAKATAIARAKHQGRIDANRGKLDIGGGRFMDKSDVDAIAAKKVQPLLDDIHERAEKERERQAAVKAEMERKREEEEVKRAREREVRENLKKLKDQDRQETKEKRREEKQEEKAKKEEEKAAKAEQRRLSRGEKHKVELPTILKPSHRTDDAAAPEHNTISKASKTPTQPTQPTRPTQPTLDPTAVAVSSPQTSEPNTPSPVDATSPASKVKGWLKARFSRPRGKSASEAEAQSDKNAERGFVGGAALRNRQREASLSSSSLDNRSASMREVALAGREPGRERDQESQKDGIEPTPSVTPRTALGSNPTGGAAIGTKLSEGTIPTAQEKDEEAHEVSSMSSSDSDETGSTGIPYKDARAELDNLSVGSGSLVPPRAMRDPNRGEGNGSPSRDSRFREMM